MDYLIYFFKKIKKLIDWLPIIWKDEDWDYAYLLHLIDFKLRRMANCIERGHTQSGESDAKRMRIVCNHIDRFFNPPAFKTYSLGDFILDDNSDDLFKRHNKPEYVFHKQQYENIQNLENWHWHQIWNIIDKHGRGWWD